MLWRQHQIYEAYAFSEAHGEPVTIDATAVTPHLFEPDVSRKMKGSTAAEAAEAQEFRGFYKRLKDSTNARMDFAGLLQSNSILVSLLSLVSPHLLCQHLILALRLFGLELNSCSLSRLNPNNINLSLPAGFYYVPQPPQCIDKSDSREESTEARVPASTLRV